MDWALSLVSEMTYTVSSGTLNSSIPYHTLSLAMVRLPQRVFLANHLEMVWYGILEFNVPLDTV